MTSNKNLASHIRNQLTYNDRKIYKVILTPVGVCVKPKGRVRDIRRHYVLNWANMAFNIYPVLVIKNPRYHISMPGCTTEVPTNPFIFIKNV